MKKKTIQAPNNKTAKSAGIERQRWEPPFPESGRRKSKEAPDKNGMSAEPPKPMNDPAVHTIPEDEPDIIFKEKDHAGKKEPKQKQIYPLYQAERKEFMNVFRKLAYHHRSWDIWTDFITMTACAISNAVDKSHYEEREATYLQTINKYNKEEQDLFPEMFTHMVIAMDENPEQDFLGEIYTELELNSKEHSQIFTPYNVCRMMAEMTLGDLAKEVEKKGFVTIHDCCCGAGATLIAAANVAKENLAKVNLNFQNYIFIIGQDIDPLVTMMCYIQMSLLGIAGYFKVGSSLTEPMTDEDNLENYWFTPMYFFPIWKNRRICCNFDKLMEGNNNEQI